MKKEWTLEFHALPAGRVSGVLVARKGRFGLPEASLDDFLKTHGQLLHDLDTLRNRHSMEPSPPPVKDMRPGTEALGLALAEVFLSQGAMDGLRRLRPAEERLVILAPAVRPWGRVPGPHRRGHGDGHRDPIGAGTGTRPYDVNDNPALQAP